MNTGPIEAPFARAARELAHPPKLSDWITLAAPTRVPLAVLRTIISVFDGRIVVAASDGISAVISNGYVRAFLPSAIYRPERDADMPIALRQVRAWLEDPAARVSGAIDFGRLRAEAGAPAGTP